jgi:hypothetical protein
MFLDESRGTILAPVKIKKELWMRN